MNKIKVMTVFGTRPEAIKMAPLVHALEQNENTESIVCVTAQHREMLDQVLDIFDIKPDYDLNIMQPRQTLATITEKSLHGLDEVLVALAVGLGGLEAHVDDLPDLHLAHRLVEALDHLTGHAGEGERLAAVARGVELRAVIERADVVDLDLLALVAHGSPVLSGAVPAPDCDRTGEDVLGSGARMRRPGPSSKGGAPHEHG